MNTEAIKILFGALALRRFSARDLQQHVGANRNTVSSVLQRYREFFSTAEGVRAGSRGRPPTIYWLTPEGTAALTQQLSELPIPSRLTLEQSEQWVEALRGDAALARRYHHAYSTAAHGEERVEAWQWFEDSMMVLDRQRQSLKAAGLRIASELENNLDELSEYLKDGFMPVETANVADDPFEDVVLKVAYDCFDDMLISCSFGENVRFDDLVDVREVGDAAGSMGIVATIGLTSHLVGSEMVRARLKQIIEKIDTRHLVDGIQRLMEPSAGLSPVTLGVMPAVAAGLRGCRQALEDNSVKRALLEVASARPLVPVLRGSCLLALQELPYEEFEGNLVPPSLPDEAPWLFPEPGPFADAIDAAVLDAIEYNERVTDRYAVQDVASTELEQFAVIFRSGQATTI